MSSSTSDMATAVDVRFAESSLVVDLSDGRTISVPVSWYPRLSGATAAQRADWRLLGGGAAIHWPQIDEDLSVAGLLAGAPAPGYRQTAG